VDTRKLAEAGLLLVATAAACFPAPKASAVDPLVALRHD
jgi:ABC-type lipoprotein release transport system permease subunit